MKKNKFFSVFFMVIALLGLSKVTICSQNQRRGAEATLKRGLLKPTDRVLKGSVMTELWEQGFTEIGGKIVSIDDPSAQLSSSQQTAELKKAEADEESVAKAPKAVIKEMMEQMNGMSLKDYREISVEERNEIVPDLVTIAKRFSAGSKEADPEIETAVRKFVKEKFVDPLNNKKSTNYDLSEAQSALEAFGELPELKEMLQTAVDKYNSRNKSNLLSASDIDTLLASAEGKRDKSLEDFEAEARQNPNYLSEAHKTVEQMNQEVSLKEFKAISSSERRETFDFLSVGLTESFRGPRPTLSRMLRSSLEAFLDKFVLDPLKETLSKDDFGGTAVLTQARIELKLFSRLTEVNKTFLDLLSERLKQEPNSAELKKVTVDFLEDNLVDSLTPKDGDPAASLGQFSQASEALKQLKDLIESPEFAGRDVAEKFKKAVKDAIEKNPRMKEKLQQILDDFEKTFPSKDAPSLTTTRSSSATPPDEGNETDDGEDDGDENDDDGDDIPRDVLLESYAEVYVSEITKAKDAGAAKITETTQDVIKRIKANQDLQPDEIAALLTQITTILDVENTVAADDEDGDGEEPFRGALMLLKKASGSAPERDPAALLSRTAFTEALNTELSEEDVSKAEKKAIDYDIRDYLENAKAIESKGFFKTFGRFIRRSVGHLMEHRKIKKIIDEGEGAVEEYIKAKANETPPNMDDIADMINTVSKYDRYPDHYIENFIKIALTEGTKQNLQEVKRRGLELLKELKGSTAAGQRFEGSASGSLTSHIANLVLDVHKEITAAENADASGGDAGELFGDNSGTTLTAAERRKRAKEAEERAKAEGKTAAGDSINDGNSNGIKVTGVQTTPQHKASGGQDDPNDGGTTGTKAKPKVTQDDPSGDGPSAGLRAHERNDGQSGENKDPQEDEGYDEGDDPEEVE